MGERSSLDTDGGAWELGGVGGGCTVECVEVLGMCTLAPGAQLNRDLFSTDSALNGRQGSSCLRGVGGGQRGATTATPWRLSLPEGQPPLSGTHHPDPPGTDTDTHLHGYFFEARLALLPGNCSHGDRRVNVK